LKRLLRHTQKIKGLAIIENVLVSVYINYCLKREGSLEFVDIIGVDKKSIHHCNFSIKDV